MHILCPQCATSYEIEAAALGEGGRQVRCARCKAAWFAAAPALEMAIPFEWEPAADGQSGPLDPPGHAGDPDNSMGSVAAAPDAGLPDDAAALPAAAEPPPLVPAMEWEASTQGHSPAEAPHEDVETVAARRAPPVKLRGRSHRWRPSAPLMILGLTAVLAALIAWRTEVVRFAPQTASLFARIGLPVNLRGLTFDAVKATGETAEGVPVMVIDGLILNATKAPVDVPRMRFALRNQAGVEVYAWTALPARPFLAEGETLPFRTRLASPPPDARDVQVRFFNRRDLEAGR
jgi:predicted Zn finger-like uncharacterized protein